MSNDLLYYIYLLVLLTGLTLLFHALRSRITLGLFFGLAGVYSIMLWQFLQTGWWVVVGDVNFNAGLTLFIPTILLGTLLTVAFDGLRTAKSYMTMVIMSSIAAWLFSVFREQLATYVPLPYLVVLSSREHLAIIAALLASQLLGIFSYYWLSQRDGKCQPQPLRGHSGMARPGGSAQAALYSVLAAFVVRGTCQFRLPLALLASIVAWLLVYSVLNMGVSMGMSNLVNELGSFLLAGLPAMAAIAVYGMIAAARGGMMPARSMKNFLSWRDSESNLVEGEDEISTRDKVISELRLLNQRLQTSARLMEYHMQYASYGVLITDALGKIERANQPAHEILRQTQLVGLNLSGVMEGVFGGVHPFREIIAHAEANRLKVSEANGASRWFDTVATPLKDGDSKAVTGYYFLLKDATGAIRAEERKVATHRIQDLNQTGRVLSHDFSNLLLGAEAQLRRIQNRVSDQETTDAAMGIAQALSHARDILKQLGAGNQFGSPKLRRENVNKLLEQAMGICKGAAEDARVTLSFHEGEPCYVEADRSQMVRVFTNLMKNAIRACQPLNRIDVTVKLLGRGVEIAVVDEGRGMSAREREMAFDPGFSTKGAGKGGLGLAISYLMVDAHGGHLDLTENPAGKGLRVAVWLPVCQYGVNLDEFAGKNVIVATNQPEKVSAIISELEHDLGCRVSDARSEDEIAALLNEDDAWDVLLLDEALNGALLQEALSRHHAVRVTPLRQVLKE